MMDTVLNIGLNDETVDGMIKLTDNERFVYDSYRRLIQMFGSVVLDIPDEAFEDPLDDFKQEKGAKVDTELTADDWKELTETYKVVIKKKKGLISPRIHSNSCAWRPKRSSAPGTANAQSITAAPPASPMIWVPRSIL